MNLDDTAVAIGVNRSGSINIDTQRTGTYRVSRNFGGSRGLWVEQEHETEHDLSVMLPKSLQDVYEFVFTATVPEIAFSEPLDIAARETEHVYFHYSPKSGNPSMAETLPLKLEKPSPHLRTLTLFGFPVTQKLLNTAAACPNLERLLIAITEPCAASAVSDPVKNVPQPANQKNMKTWAFSLPGVETVTDWQAPQLRTLVMSHTQMGHIPRGLLASPTLAGVTARYNQIGHQDATETLQLVAGSAFQLDLTGNQLEEIPLLGDTDSTNVCYHSETVEFGIDCGCLHMNSREQGIPPTGPARAYSNFPTGDDLLTDFEKKKRFHESRMVVVVRENPLMVGSYPQLQGPKTRSWARSNRRSITWYRPRS